MDHPALAPWTGSARRLPSLRSDPALAELGPALHAGMDAYRADLAAITACRDAPTFGNTIVALEEAGRGFARAAALFGVYTSTMNDKPMQQLEAEMAPVLSAFGDEITQNAALFARIAAVHAARAQLAPDEQRLVDVVYEGFARRGAALDAPAKLRMTAINARLATLYTRFSQNVLADEESQALVLHDEAELAGHARRAARRARPRPEPGTWRFANTRSSMEPLLTLAARRDVREAAWRLFTSRGEHAGEHDNRGVIGEILALRAERAKLLGFATHAHWILDDNMARTPDAAMALMRKVWTAATARVREEVAAMQAMTGEKIAPWDYRYYAEKVRKDRYDLDQDAVKPYLVLDQLRDAMFWMAGELYGLAFARVRDVPVVHPDVTVYAVTRDGQHVGLWYFDPYARDGKQSGAWMSEYRTQERGITPVVSNNANFVPAAPGEPVLISWDDAITMFHEYGHALHGLVSSVAYPTLAGTNVKRDFVEFPSQLNEHWFTTPEILRRYAVHYQTGAAIPDELVAKIETAKHHGSGFQTVEYLAAAIYDLAIHTVPADQAAAIDPIAFEAATMRELGCPPEIVMRHRPTQFGHIFSGDGYSAGYYAYIWADTLTADAAEAFVEAGSFYDRAVAHRLRDAIMAVGNSVAPEAAFRAFRGRDVDTDALMRDRGFPVSTRPSAPR